MLDERMGSIHKQVQQAVALIQRLKEEKENLKKHKLKDPKNLLKDYLTQKSIKKQKNSILN